MRSSQSKQLSQTNLEGRAQTPAPLFHKIKRSFVVRLRVIWMTNVAPSQSSHD